MYLNSVKIFQLTRTRNPKTNSDTNTNGESRISKKSQLFFSQISGSDKFARNAIGKKNEKKHLKRERMGAQPGKRLTVFTPSSSLYDLFTHPGGLALPHLRVFFFLSFLRIIFKVHTRLTGFPEVVRRPINYLQGFQCGRLHLNEKKMNDERIEMRFSGKSTGERSQ